MSTSPRKDVPSQPAPAPKKAPRKTSGRRPTAAAAIAAQDAKRRSLLSFRAVKAEQTRAQRLAALRSRQARRAARREARIETAARWRARAVTALRAFMVTGPVAAPMVVAWTGQAGFAMRVLGWNFASALLYAAAYELTTVFCAWMHHQARVDGDSGFEYRLATWSFAAGSATQQWWHYSAHWHATPRAVTFSSMTIVGLIVWELHARLLHRRALRAQGKVEQARPHFGLARWLRFPRRTWTAWSLTVRDSRLSTIDLAWTAADRHLARTAPGPRRTRRWRTAPPAATPDLTPEVRLDRAAPTPAAVRRADPGPLDPAPVETPAVRPALPPSGPGSATPDPAAPFEPTDLELQALAALRTAGLSLSRANVADHIRNTMNGNIATTRAAQVAKWGRDNGPTAGSQLKAV